MPPDRLVMVRQEEHQPLHAGIAQQPQGHLLVCVERIKEAVDERSDAGCVPGRRGVGEARERAVVESESLLVEKEPLQRTEAPAERRLRAQIGKTAVEQPTGESVVRLGRFVLTQRRRFDSAVPHFRQQFLDTGVHLLADGGVFGGDIVFHETARPFQLQAAEQLRRFRTFNDQADGAQANLNRRKQQQNCWKFPLYVI